jgi:hypothetical protein
LKIAPSLSGRLKLEAAISESGIMPNPSRAGQGVDLSSADAGGAKTRDTSRYTALASQGNINCGSPDKPDAAAKFEDSLN